MNKKKLPSMESICSKHVSLTKTKMKEKLKVFGTALMLSIATIVLLLALSKLMDVFASDGSPIALTPQAQTVYDQAEITFCEAEKNLANAKLTDYVNELIELNEDDLVRLHGKRGQTCDSTYNANGSEIQVSLPTPKYVCEGEETYLVNGVNCLPQSQWNIYSTIESPLREELMAMSWKESRFDCAATGDYGQSHGCFQIHRGYHPDVSIEQARDLWFAINWTIDRISYYGYDSNKRYAISCHNGCYNYRYADYILNLASKYQSLTS